MKDDGITTGKVRHLRVLDTSVPPPLPPPHAHTQNPQLEPTLKKSELFHSKLQKACKQGICSGSWVFKSFIY